MVISIKNLFFYVAAVVGVVVTAVVPAVVQFDASQPCERITRTRVYLKVGRTYIFSRQSQP